MLSVSFVVVCFDGVCVFACCCRLMCVVCCLMSVVVVWCCVFDRCCLLSLLYFVVYDLRVLNVVVFCWCFGVVEYC